MIAVSVAKFMESFVQIGPPLREEIGYILTYITIIIVKKVMMLALVLVLQG